MVEPRAVTGASKGLDLGVGLTGTACGLTHDDAALTDDQCPTTGSVARGIALSPAPIAMVISSVLENLTLDRTSRDRSSCAASRDRAVEDRRTGDEHVGARLDDDRAVTTSIRINFDIERQLIGVDFTSSLVDLAHHVADKGLTAEARKHGHQQKESISPRNGATLRRRIRIAAKRRAVPTNAPRRSGSRSSHLDVDGAAVSPALGRLEVASGSLIISGSRRIVAVLRRTSRRRADRYVRRMTVHHVDV